MGNKISVIMTTYNGEKFIIEQLKSIKEQTISPNEVMIFDDCSSDNTVKIIKNYILENSLDNWKLCKNKKNLGWRKNFMQGFSRATGDIIFSADQDDIWYFDKIEKMVDTFNRIPEIEVLACNIEPFYEGNEFEAVIAPHYLNNYGTKRIEKVKFDNLWLEARRIGCTMAFKRSVFPYIQSVWFERCSHDLAMWAYGVAKGTMYILNEKLVKYRRHTNTNTPKNDKTASFRSDFINVNKVLAERFLSQAIYLKLDKDVVKTIEILVDFYSRRYKAIANRDIIAMILLFKDISLYLKPSSYVADVISSFR